MPIDSYEDEDEAKRPGEELGRARRFGDFDCPDCNANNPYDDGFGPNDEIRCFYCGQEFRAELTEEGRWRFREL